MTQIFRKWKKPLSSLLVLTLVFALVLPLFSTSVNAVSQAELDALKQKQEEIASQKSDIQAKLDDANDKVTSQQEKLDLLNEQLTLTNQELENLSEQIALYTNSIAKMENQLTEAKQQKLALLKEYKAYIRAMEENGSYSYVAVLMGASSFSDLLTRIDDIREIMTYQDNLIGQVEAAQARIETAKTDMETEMAAQQEVFTEYQAKQADLAQQQEEAQTLLESLAADSADYQDQLSDTSALQASIAGQISDMQAQLDELARIKAEQEAAAAAAAAAANQSGTGSSSSGSGSSGGSIWYGDSAGTATGQDIVNYAEGFLGVPYVYGGTSPSGFDCSGLVYYCYAHYGYSVNRTAAGLAYSGTSVSASSLQPGDVILFTSSDGSYIGHTGIYIGGGQFIHAPHTGDVVKISSLSESYYTSHYYGARRIVG